MTRSARLLLASLIDYAGTFPLVRFGVVTLEVESFAQPHAEVP